MKESKGTISHPSYLLDLVLCGRTTSICQMLTQEKMVKMWKILSPVSIRRLLHERAELLHKEPIIFY